MTVNKTWFIVLTMKTNRMIGYRIPEHIAKRLDSLTQTYDIPISTLTRIAVEKLLVGNNDIGFDIARYRENEELQKVEKRCNVKEEEQIRLQKEIDALKVILEAKK